MDLLKSFGEEISRVMDSSQIQEKSDKGEETQSFSSVDENTNLSHDKSHDQHQEDWGEWEEVKKTPKTTPSKTPATLDKSVYSTPSATESPESSLTTPTIIDKPKSSGKAQIDSMSRDDLIKYVKKQTILLQKMKARTEELNQECSKLRTELTTKPQTTPTDNEHLIRELQVLKTERDQCQSETKKVKQIIVSIEQEKQETISKLEGKLADITSEKSTLENTLAQNKIAMTTNKEEAEKEITELKDDVARLQERVESVSKEKETLEQCLRDSEERQRKFETEQELAQTKVTTLEEELNHKVEEWAHEKERLSSELTQVQTVLRETIDNHSSAINGLQEELGQWQNKTEERERELTTAHTENIQLLSQCESLQQQMKDLRDNVTILKEKEDAAKSQIVSLETQLATFQVEKETGGREEEEMRKEVTRLTHQLQASVDEREKVKEEMEKVSEQYEQLTGEVGDMRSANSDLERDVMVKTEEIDLLKKQIEALSVNNETINDDTTEQVKCIEEEKTKLIQKLETQETVHKEEVKKLKAIAMKLKKELSEIRERETSLREQLEKQNDSTPQLKQELKETKEERDTIQKETAETVSNITTELESVRKQLVQEQNRSSQLEQTLQDFSKQYDQSQQELEINVRTLSLEKNNLTQSVHELEDSHASLRSELESVKTDLLSSQSELTTTSRALNDSTLEITSLREILTKEREELVDIKQKLAAAEKEMKSSSLMDLELADYQRSIETLRGQVKVGENNRNELEKKITTLEKQIEDVTQELATRKQECTQKEEAITKMKTMLRKSAKELMDSKSQFTESQQINEDLKKELETEKQNMEIAKVEVAELTAKLQSNQQQFDSTHSHYQRLVHTLETKVSSLQTEITDMTGTLQQTKEEHESYKVRVHSVLKQKQTSPSISELENNLRQQHEVELLKTKAELKNTQERLTTLLSEHEELEVEHQQLIGRHDDYLHDTKKEIDQLKERLQDSEVKLRIRTQEHEDLVSQLRLEIHENTAAFKAQTQTLQNKHQSEVKKLNDELIGAHDEISRLQQDADSLVLARGRPLQTPQETVHNIEKAKVVPTEERSSGEGMDRNELEVSGLTTPTSHTSEDQLMSFERLLSTTSNDLGSLNGRSQTPQLMGNEVELLEQVALATKKTTHLTELLHESEANCVRLTDQTKLLKEEIRRLERNQERQHEASNMEYLKNVVLKFLHSNNEERTGLIPIITRLLQLSQQERQFLQETFKGRKVDLPDASGSNSLGVSGAKGWANYLHRWTGY